MATLLVNLPANADTTTISLSAALGTAGDEASTVTIDAEVMNVISGIGTRELTVDRGATPVAHAYGAAVTYTAGAFSTTTPTVRIAAGVPSGAPTGTELPIAVDSTASTGGIYVWDGASWTKYASIP